jgi:hypothetical protein
LSAIACSHGLIKVGSPTLAAGVAMMIISYNSFRQAAEPTLSSLHCTKEFCRVLNLRLSKAQRCGVMPGLKIPAN